MLIKNLEYPIGINKGNLINQYMHNYINQIILFTIIQYPQAIWLYQSALKKIKEEVSFLTLL